MFRFLKRSTIDNLVSPYGLAFASYCVFLFAWLFPPGTYTLYMQEPDIMFLDPLTFLFFTGCVLAFMGGVRASHLFGLARRTVTPIAIRTNSPLTYLCLPIAVGTCFCAAYLVKLGGKINFVGLLVSSQGAAIKAAARAGETDVGGRWGISVLFLTVVLWWAYLRSSYLPLGKSERLIFRSFFVVGLLVNVLTCIATVDRTQLMPLVIGLSIIQLYKSIKFRNKRLSQLLLTFCVQSAAVVALFTIFQMYRGSLLLDMLVRSILGYSIVSYNRLAALLHGQMYYIFGGKGVYLFPYLLRSDRLNDFLDLSHRFDWPPYLTLFDSESASVQLAGLNSSYIWSGVFGYLYADLGVGALAYLFGTGVLAGWAWTRFRKGVSWAIAIYVWIGFWIVFWVGWNLLFDMRFVTVVEAAILLALYERVSARRISALEQQRIPQLTSQS